MRFVIYDDETMEPITVVNATGFSERDIWERLRGRLELLVPPRIQYLRPEPPEAYVKPCVISLWFEQFVRKGQISLMCFTKQTELAMLLEPAFLPGQQAYVNDLREQNEWLTDLVIKALADQLG